MIRISRNARNGPSYNVSSEMKIYSKYRFHTPRRQSRLPRFGCCQDNCELHQGPCPDAQSEINKYRFARYAIFLERVKKFNDVRCCSYINQQQLTQLVAR